MPLNIGQPLEMLRQRAAVVELRRADLAQQQSTRSSGVSLIALAPLPNAAGWFRCR
jgi:hypothetical protein